MSTTSRGEYLHSPSEEIAHAATHGLGALLAIAGLVVMLVVAARSGDVWHVVAAAIYCSSLVLLYLSSTLYHAMPSSKAKRVLQAFDHGAIYVLIAGTYTPFTLVTMRGPWGWTLFGVVWGLALAGIAQELVFRRRFRWISLVFYLAMGWLIAIAAKPLADNLPSKGLFLIALGGLFYTAGIYFYVSRRVPYHHAIWHLFVLAGSVCHYFTILFYVMP